LLVTDPIAEFLAKGGQVTKVPRSKRNLTGTHFRYLTRGELLNAASYHTVREERLKDAAARRAQRGKPKGK
jgi:hypothetical protein